MSQALIESTKIEPREGGDICLRFALQGGTPISFRARREAIIRLIAQLEMEVMPTHEEKQTAYRATIASWHQLEGAIS